jgi:SAM-dependent methyltransferase
MMGFTLELTGECPVCREPTRFVANDPWLRDHLLCQRCGSIPRERALVVVLDRRVPGWRELAIHESSPGTSLSRRLQLECPRYMATQYFPDVPPGALRDGVRCENLEALTFADASFDVVLSLDVMEHVLDPDAAFREIARTLRPGGAHVFTTPLVPGLRRSEARARRGPGGVELLAEPEYHHNPIDPMGALVTIHYGEDIADRIQRASGLTTTIYHLQDPGRGLLGEFIEVLFSAKTP